LKFRNSMEEFSQSRGDDDLFDDEIVPCEPPQQDALATQLQNVSLQSPAAVPVVNKGNGSSRGSRGRGRGGALKVPGKKNDLEGSKWATQPAPALLPKEVPLASQEPPDTSARGTESLVGDDGTAATTLPESSAPQTPSRPAAVRGDRTGTGGVKKPKLTEDELTAKLLAAKERSQNLSAAHARAQADAASFEERERIAQHKRAKEKVERRAMDNERQKNAARKAAAMGGREWDLQKNEEDFRIQSGRGGARQRGGQMRTMNGTTAERSDPGLDDLSQYQWHEGRGRGLGDRGRARGGPRGGRGDARGGSKQPNVKAETDFPALPGAKSTEIEKQPASQEATKKMLEVSSPATGKSSWADQVDESEAAKA
jgi:hypothetical protein